MAKLVFEVPTGMFVDKYGIRRGLAASFICSGLTWFSFPFMRSVWITTVVILVWALSDALVSGTYETWISRSVGEHEFGKAVRKRTQVMIVILILASIFSGNLYRLNPLFPFLSIAFLYFVQLVVVLTVPAGLEADSDLLVSPRHIAKS